MSTATTFSTEADTGAFPILAEAMRDGAADASHAVNDLMPGILNAVSQVAYSGCYYASFGVCFSALFISRALPKHGAILRGLHDGAGAASVAVQRLSGMHPEGLDPTTRSIASGTRKKKAKLAAEARQQAARRARGETLATAINLTEDALLLD